MNKKQISGLVLVVLGIALTIFAIHSMNRISDAKRDVKGFNSIISDVPMGGVVGNALEGKASEHDTEVLLCLIGGIVLILGGGAIFLYRKKQ